MGAVSDRRVLIPLTYGFSVRYAVPTGLLDQLRRVCTPVVGLGWDDPELTAQLESEGFEVVQLPSAQMTHEYRNHARLMDRLHRRRLHSPTTRIRAARWKRRGLDRRRFIEEIRAARDWVAVMRPGGVEQISGADDEVLRTQTNLGDVEHFLGQLDISGVLSFTPYHDQDVLALVAAARRGATTVVSVISFDNPTIRGRLPVVPDQVMVWSREMADQIVRSHPGIHASDVKVVGAPQFDLHRQPRLIIDEAEWRRSLGLPEGRPILLWGAGPSRLVPHEHRLVEVVDRAISSGELPGDPFLLVRRHPVDGPETWEPHQAQLSNAVVAAPWVSTDAPMRSWPTIDDLQMQMSSLAHSAVHINVCSSMTVDGAMFDRPQVGPEFLPGADRLQQKFVRDFYRQEHWQPIARSGGLVMARNEAELISTIRGGLVRPAALSAGRGVLVESILTRPDGRATNRLVEQVGSVLDAG